MEWQKMRQRKRKKEKWSAMSKTANIITVRRLIRVYSHSAIRATLHAFKCIDTCAMQCIDQILICSTKKNNIKLKFILFALYRSTACVRERGCECVCVFVSSIAYIAIIRSCTFIWMESIIFIINKWREWMALAANRNFRFFCCVFNWIAHRQQVCANINRNM